MKIQWQCLVAVVFVAVATVGCASRQRQAVLPTVTLPSSIAGEFVDDYGIAYTITSAEWFQRPRARYHIVKADTTAGYLIARNDEGNPADRGRWTRIDWVRLNGMAPYDWAFCLSAYDAPTMSAAEQVTIARRDTPRTGCNGHPFSRMKRRAATS